MKKPPTYERVRELFSYDPLTGVVTWRVSRKGHVKAGDVTGSVYDTGIRVGVDGRYCSLSNVIWLWMTGVWPTVLIDHKNKDPLDNRWENLREADKSLNLVNTKPRSSLGVKNVMRHGTGYRVVFRIKKKNHYFGTYPTLEEAEKHAKLKAEELYGEFAGHKA